MAKRKKQPPATVTMILVIQGKPTIISGDDGEPHMFQDMEAARDFTCTAHMGVMAAEHIYILDCETGEMDHF